MVGRRARVASEPSAWRLSLGEAGEARCSLMACCRRGLESPFLSTQLCHVHVHIIQLLLCLLTNVRSLYLHIETPHLDFYAIKSPARLI